MRGVVWPNLTSASKGQIGALGLEHHESETYSVEEKPEIW